MLRALPLYGRLTGRRVVDRDEEPAGRVVDVVLDADLVCWAVVHVGGREHVAPLGGSGIQDGRLRLGVTRAAVESAPAAPTAGVLADVDLVRLEHHYG